MKTKILTNKRAISGLLTLMLFTCVSCDDFIDVGMPKTEITTNTVFSNDASATAAVLGIYSKMMSNSSFTKGDLERYTGLSSDELINYSPKAEQTQFYQGSLAASNNVVYRNFWGEAYYYISNANSILEGLEHSETLTPNVKKQLQGEALFIRAYCHFYLANLFGDVPYVKTTNYSENSKMPRMPIVGVYTEIVNDLLEAKSVMPQTIPGTDGNLRPGINAVRSLLARTYLYTKQWALAEQEVTDLISSAQFSLAAVVDVFKATSTETIWQLRPVVPGTNTPQAQMFILTGAPANSLGAVALSQELVDLFEPSDNRLTSWIGRLTTGASTYYFAYKYKAGYSSQVTEYSIIFRLAEMYLIRAEARAEQNKFVEGKSDLDIIRTRAGQPNSTATDSESLLDAIADERRMELFTENGQRWLDLKRTSKAGNVLPQRKPGWDSNDELYPIPQPERMINTNLSQNPGY